MEMKSTINETKNMAAEVPTLNIELTKSQNDGIIGIDVSYFDTVLEQNIELHYADALEFKRCASDLNKRGIKKKQLALDKLLEAEMKKCGVHTQLTHQYLGFIGDKDTFYYVNSYGKGASIYRGSLLKVDPITKKVYCPIAAAGSLDTVKQAIKEHLIGIPEGEIILCASAYSLYTDYMDDTENPLILSVRGATHTAKTSMARDFVLSLWGNPNELKVNADITDAATNEVLAERRIIPFVLDDILARYDFNSKKFIPRIISLSDGMTKAKYGRDGVKYHSPIITTSVESLLESLYSNNAGQGTRVLELTITEDTFRSAENVNALKAVIKSNYGLVIPELADFMLKTYTPEELKGIKAAHKASLEVEDRMANHMSTLLTMGQLMNECFGFGIDLEKMGEVLISSYNTATMMEASIKPAYDYVREIYVKNPELFSTREEYDAERHLGVVDNTECGIELSLENHKLFNLFNYYSADEACKAQSQLPFRGVNEYEMARQLRKLHSKGRVHYECDSAGVNPDTGKTEGKTRRTREIKVGSGDTSRIVKMITLVYQNKKKEARAA